MATDEHGVIRFYDYNPNGEYFGQTDWLNGGLLVPSILDPDSNNGQRLLCRTEFDAHAEHKTVLTIARRPVIRAEENDMADDEPVSAQAESVLVCGKSLPKRAPQSDAYPVIAATLEGSISILSPIDATTYKRLALLQGQLVRNVQHVAALNPKAFR